MSIEKSVNETIELFHKGLLYPIVRVRTEKAGGSGTIIYSKPDPKNPKEYETYILTNHHVIEDAIQIKKKWSSIAKREIEKEIKATVFVELFEYKYLSTIIGGTTYEADIVAWDKDEDLALLKLRTIHKMPYVAKMFPRGKSETIKLFTKVFAVGCSLGHPPIPTLGQITSKHDEIENKEYWMSTAQIIFGNSGGAMFLADSLEFIGVPARISAIQLGFGIDVITHMGFFIPIERVYKFFEDQIFYFLYDPKYTSVECEELRKKKEEEEERKLILPK